MIHQYQDLISLFNQIFFERYNTKLVLGDDEPIYLPASGDVPYHRVIFARGYYASALHEIAHWCVAGPERRLQEDYGYWYEPDGRTMATQAAFEDVEVRPQAYEYIFSSSTGYPFTVSCDNLSGPFEPNREAFFFRVQGEAKRILRQGLPSRVAMFVEALCKFYNLSQPTVDQFLER